MGWQKLLGKHAKIKKKSSTSSFDDEDLYNALEYDAAPSELDNETFQRNVTVMFYSANIPFRLIGKPAF
ncbi:hypothetical protein GN244_ATG14498 [Phytophthora infestans]|uniref:Uncharacterized protein n=1 Tax=Phytophthora infestans TaxID=4787 RepID=A0A833SF59_PHYIN|nr:hypothetical protein GN244_ATG14498 [Phytophthora infestans]KAF4137142.1 hypothetical protein GN958_ATG13671 [Phytophthora infestans]